MKKNNLVLVFVCFLIIGNLAFVLAEENKTINLAEVLGLKDVEIYGENINYQSLEGGNLAIYFNEKESFFVDKDGNVFNEVNFEKDNFILLNSNGEIIKIDLWTTEMENVFILNKNRVPVPANSHFYFSGNKVTINVADDSKFLERPLFSDDFPIEINGKNIKLSENLLLKEGTFLLDSNGTFLLKGLADFNKMRLSVSDEKNKVLIIDSNKNLDGFFGNYVKFVDGKLEIKSQVEGNVNLEVLPGNDFFGTNKRKYERDKKGEFVLFEEEGNFFKDEQGFKYELIPDEKDFLNLNLKNGDSLIIKERIEEDRKLIPLIEHNSFEGGSTIVGNGLNTFVLNGSDLFWETKKYSTKEEFLETYKGKYKSLPFELESNSFPKGYFLKGGSAEQFELVSFDGKDIKINYNAHNLNIEKFQDESLKTIDQLSIKYPNINFDLLPINSFPEKISKEYTEPTPQMLQLVNQWLEDHPDATLKEFVFSNKGSNAVNMFGSIKLDESLIYKPHNEDELLVLGRNLGGYYTITHEYEHYMDIKIFQEESLEIENLKYSILENKEHALFIKAEKYSEQKMQNKNLSILVEVGLSGDLSSFKEKIEKEFIYNGKSESNPNFEFEVELKTAELLGMNVWDLRTVEKNSRTVFGTCYNSNKQKLGRELTSQEYHTIDCSSFIKSLLSESQANFLKKINYIVKKEDIIKTYLDYELSEKMLIASYDQIILERKDILIENEEFKKTLQKFIKLINDNKEDLDEESRKNLNYFFELEDKEKIGALFYSSVYTLSNQIPELKKEYINLINQIDKKGGLPSAYALLRTSFGTYDELSSTYIEEDLKERYSKLNFGTPAQKEVYTKLTQLAFDSGKMPQKEYTYLMGSCERSDCLDKRCANYKLLCCEQYPNSPNC